METRLKVQIYTEKEKVYGDEVYGERQSIRIENSIRINYGGRGGYRNSCCVDAVCSGV